MIRFLQTPGKLKKYVLGGLLLLICVTMVITLIPGGFMGDALGFGGGEQGVLAKVGSEEVTFPEVQRAARRMGRRQFQRGIPPQLMPYLVQSAADNLILQKALVVEAGRMGFKVTNQDLLDELQRGQLSSQLFPGGNFIGDASYQAFVQQFDMSVPQFEEAMKTELLVRKLREAIEGGVTVAEGDLQQAFREQNTKVKFEYAVISPEDLMKQVKATDVELKAFFQNRINVYQNSIPEKRRVRYVVVDAGKLPNAPAVTEDELKRYYQQHQDEYRVPEEVNVRHILIKTPMQGADGKPDAKGVEQAKAKAEDVLKKLKAGGNFAELAKKSSDDPGSAQQGGSLGWIQRGRTVPEFEKAAFSLPKGQTSELVQSSFGFHIIRVDDKHEARLKPVAEVRNEIEPIVAREKNQKAADALANTMVTEARTQGLEKAGSKHGLPVQTSGLISAADTLPGVGAPEFTQAVFAQREKSPPEAVRTQQGAAIFEITEIKPAATPTFEEIREQVERDFKTERARAMLSQKTQELSERARAQHDLKKAAKEMGVTVKTSEPVGRDSQVPDVGPMSGPAAVAFGMNKGEISGPIAADTNGLVIALLEKQEPQPGEWEKSREQLRDSVLRRKRAEVFEVFVSSLRERMMKEGKIRINEKEMNRIMAAYRQDAG